MTQRGLNESLDRLDIEQILERNSVFRSRFGSNFVTTERTNVNSHPRLTRQPNFHHPGALQTWGTSTLVDARTNARNMYHVHELLDFTLRQFNVRVRRLVGVNHQPIPIFITILTQVLDLLSAMMRDGRAHGNLSARNVGLILYPHMHGLTPEELLVLDITNIRVKLLGDLDGRHGNLEYTADLERFGSQLVLPFFLNANNELRSEEVIDLLWKINPTAQRPATPNHHSHFTIDEKNILSAIFHTQYLHCPKLVSKQAMSWKPKKSLNFLCLADELVGRVYLRDRGNNLAAGVQGFIDHLKLLDVTGWQNNLHPTMLRYACRFPYWPVAGEDDTTIGYVKGIRNVRTHWFRYGSVDRTAVGGQPQADDPEDETECYEYFRQFSPMLVVHVYGCIELHYDELRAHIGPSFCWSFEEYMSSYGR